MQTNFKSLADIKKRVPMVSDIQSPYRVEPHDVAKNTNNKLRITDTWICNITIIAFGAIVLKAIISVLL